MKKILKFSVLLLAVGLILGLAGCDDGNGDNNGEDGGDVGKGTIRLGIWPEDTMSAEIAMHEKFVAEFNKKYPEMKVVPAQYRYAVDTFISLAVAGNVPTIFETWFTEPQKLIANGYVKDITTEVKALGWDAKMNPAIKDLLSANGKIYGIPRDGYAMGLMLNVDLFRKAGLVDGNGIPQYPKTWDELATVAQTIKEKTGAAGLCLLAKDNAGGWHFTNIAWGFGAKFSVLQGKKWVAQVNSPEAVAALQYVKDLKWKYNVLTANPTNEDWSSGFQALGTAQAAMYIAAQDAVNQPTMANGLPVGDLALVPVPAGPKGQFSLMGGTPYMFSNKASSGEIRGALQYLELMGAIPVVTPEVVAGLEAGAQMRKNEGVPVIPPFPAWTDAAYLTAQMNAVDKYRNVDMRLYNDYYAIIKKSGNLKTEEADAMDLYSELTKCLQAVLTDQNANPKALLDTAQNNYQRMLDAELNET